MHSINWNSFFLSKILIVVFVFFCLSCTDVEDLNQQVLKDFREAYPMYHYVSHQIEEADLAVVYIEVTYTKFKSDSSFSEVWQYWDTSSGWKKTKVTGNDFDY